MKLRIKFRKYGTVRYIGHLDVMRFFQKAVRRAGIDVRYTNGFSPHQVMTFAAPLGVGITSNGEYMDIEVNFPGSGNLPESDVCPEDMEEGCRNIWKRLNEAGVPGIEIVSVKILPDTAGNAMASVAAASYTVGFRKGREPRADFAAKLPRFLAKDRIPVRKKTKKGIREVDLREGIFRLSYTGESLSMLLDASSGGNIKPVQVVEALLAEEGEQLQENALLVTREDVYTRTEEGRMVSLDEIGLAGYSGHT